MVEIENKKYWIWLSLIEGLGPIRKRKLLELYKTPKKIYNLGREELLEIEGIGENTVKNILQKYTKEIVNKHIQYMLNNDIDIININEKEYPQKLKGIYDPPVSLYIKGNREILNDKSIAIVGCREASLYGKKAAKYFSYELSKENINIVSGMAKGIDSYAHYGNIYANNKNKAGKTIAVVGNGLDNVYPIENEKLAKNILKNNGAIISEYPLGTKPNKMNFPARNRIISGISDGVIVVEAKGRSGALITADFALEQGREVFVVPGNINSINSVGTNNLIKEGANLITNIKDIERILYN